MLLVLALVGAGLVGLLLLNTAINENAFRLHELKQRQDALDLREQQLQRDVAELEAPGTLLAAARRLGLVEAGPPGYIRLPEGTVKGSPTPARASTPPVVKTSPTPNAGTPSNGTTANPGTPGAGQPTNAPSAGRPGNTAPSNTATGNTAGNTAVGGSPAGSGPPGTAR